MKNSFNCQLLFFILLVSVSCQQNPVVNEETEKNKILELHDLQRKYHLEKMAEEFAAQLSPDNISVNRGEISTATYQENVERFGNYFNSVEFEKWDDLQPPIIRFSDDYSLAYVIVNKEVVLKYPIEEGKVSRQSTVYSWVSIYKKYEDGWKIDCVASTNKPTISEEL